MEDSVFEAKYPKIKSLVQYRDKTKEEVRAILESKEKIEADVLDVGDMFKNKEERRYAIALGGKYLAEYDIESIAEKNALRQLVYLETFQVYRIQQTLNDYQEEKKLPPPSLVDSLHRNIDEITALKNQLRLHRPKEQHLESGLKTLETLKKKFVKWREENQGSRTTVCPHCGQMIMLKIRTTAWDAQKHPFFKDRILTNKHLLDLYSKNKITKEDVALVLETSEDYITWLLSKALPASPASKNSVDVNQLEFNFNDRKDN